MTSTFPVTARCFIRNISYRVQVKGKAAIDGLGSRLGKSGASFLQQGLVLAFGNILRAAPFVAGVSLYMSFSIILSA